MEGAQVEGVQQICSSKEPWSTFKIPGLTPHPSSLRRQRWIRFHRWIGQFERYPTPNGDEQYSGVSIDIQQNRLLWPFSRRRGRGFSGTMRCNGPLNAMQDRTSTF